MKTNLIIVGVLILVIAGVWVWLGQSGPAVGSPDPTAGTFSIDGEYVSLTGDYHYYGNRATGDLNGDGVEDVAFAFTHDPGGSGTFYYATAMVSVDGQWVGTDAVFLGDRVRLEPWTIRDGILTVDFKGHGPGQAMTDEPAYGVERFFRVRNGVLTEIPPVEALPTDEPIACTADAMQCPDGSWVGRTGPNCEFVCP